MTEHNTNRPPFEYQHQWNGDATYPGQPTPPKKQRWFKKPLVWVPAIALLCGVGIGSGSARTETVAAEPTPAVTVTAAPKVETRTVTVEKTPAACITALDLAQEGFTYSSESMGYMNDALQAAGRFDVAGLQQANADMELLNPKISALTEPMSAAVSECRAKE